MIDDSGGSIAVGDEVGARTVELVVQCTLVYGWRVCCGGGCDLRLHEGYSPFPQMGPEIGFIIRGKFCEIQDSCGF